MRSPKPSIGWRLLLDSGLLHYILPELEEMVKVDAVRGRAHKNNFDHTLKVLDNVAEVSDDVWLRWSALFHKFAAHYGKIIQTRPHLFRTPGGNIRFTQRHQCINIISGIKEQTATGLSE